MGRSGFFGRRRRQHCSNHKSDRDAQGPVRDDLCLRRHRGDAGLLRMSRQSRRAAHVLDAQRSGRKCGSCKSEYRGGRDQDRRIDRELRAKSRSSPRARYQPVLLSGWYFRPRSAFLSCRAYTRAGVDDQSYGNDGASDRPVYEFHAVGISRAVFPNALGFRRAHSDATDLRAARESAVRGILHLRRRRSGSV